MKYKQLISKIYSCNNKVILCYGMWSCLRNQRSKETSLVDLQFLSNYELFSKNWCRKLLKKEYESMLYNFIERLVDWTSREFQN